MKIVAVTASGFESQRSEVLAAGLDDYVRKPYRPDEIFDCMARHLGVQYRRADKCPSGVEDRPALLWTPSHNCPPHCASNSVVLWSPSTRH